jgi:hypothetical protein
MRSLVVSQKKLYMEDSDKLKLRLWFLIGNNIGQNENKVVTTLHMNTAKPIFYEGLF